MRLMRMTATAVLILIGAGSAGAQCVSEVRQIGRASSSTSLVAGPIAWSGAAMAILTTQSDTKSLGVSLYDERGGSLADAKLPSTDEADPIGIFWDGADFGVFYESSIHDLVFRKVSSTGAVVGSAKVVPRLKLGDDDKVDIAFSSILDAYVVARTVMGGTPELWLTYVERDGRVRKNVEVAKPDDKSFVRIAITETGVVGVFFDHDRSDDIVYLRVVEGQANVEKRVWRVGLDLLVSTRGSQFVLAKTVEQVDSRIAVRWKTIDTSGNDVIEESRIVLADKGHTITMVSLMGRELEDALSYVEKPDSPGDEPVFRLVRFEDDGRIVSDTNFSLDSRRINATGEDDFIWTGHSYVTTATRAVGSGFDSFLVRFCPLIANISGPRAARPAEEVTFTSSVQGGQPGYQYVWEVGGHTVGFEQSVTMHFDQEGTYDVHLTVTDLSRTTASETFTIVVTSPTQLPPQRRRSVRK